MPKKKQTADFRYETGDAQIPWDAVGEKINAIDLEHIIKFLIIPKNGYEKQYSDNLEKVKSSLNSLWRVGKPSTKLSLGNNIKELETVCKKYLKVKHACFLTNATAGFEIGYKFADLKQGDEVIAPAITFIATIAYPLSIGAKVVFADINPETLNMDPEDVKRKISRKTKVIIPVHIGGYPTDMDPIMNIAKKRKITVIEDAAHAFGGMYKGRMTGTIGHFGAYSFHEVKNINSFGEGGLLVTNLDAGEDFSKCRFLGLDFTKTIPNWLYDITPVRNLRRKWFVAGNHSSTEIQAVTLISQLKRIKTIIGERRKAFTCLRKRFSEDDAIYLPPEDTKETKGTHHLYLFRINPEKAGGTIQDLKELLKKRGITHIPHFGPLYHFDLLKKMGYNKKEIAEQCPNTEQVFHNEFTHLPLYKFPQEKLDYLADKVLDALNEMRG